MLIIQAWSAKAFPKHQVMLILEKKFAIRRPETSHPGIHESHIIGCGTGQVSFRYLEIPINHRKLSNMDWTYVDDCNKLGNWKRKLCLMTVK